MTSRLTLLLGVRGSGKDYRANQLINVSDALGFSMEKVCFADELRNIAWELLNWKPKTDEEYELFKLSKINIPRFGFVDGRKFLQDLGTSMRKRNNDFWVKCWTNLVVPVLNTNKNVVCSDLRFPNELKTALTICTDKDNPPVNKEFLFCDYRSERYNNIDTHESERMAQRILKDGYKDGDVLEFDYLWSLVNNTDYMKTETPSQAKEFKGVKNA